MSYIHGGTGSPLYRTWKNMRRRCDYEKQDKFKHYGGRGITVCTEWNNSFEVFENWSIKNGYAPTLELGRLDNDKGYSPDNCAWQTHQENMNNTRSSKKLTIFGETKTITQWAADPRCKTGWKNLFRRISRGWAAERALITPTDDRFAMRYS